MPSVQLHFSFPEHLIYIIDALVLRSSIFIEACIIFPDVELSSACDREILIPIDRHTMVFAVIAMLRDVFNTSHRGVSVGVNLDGGVIALDVCLFGLEYTVCDAVRCHEVFLSPKVGKRLMLQKAAVLLHVSTVYILL